MRQVVLDTETTGLEPSQGHRIIEIGCVEVVNRRLTEVRFHQYLRPDRAIDSGAVEVHGITDEFLADKPPFEAVVEEFLSFIRDAEVIIHNAPFDVGFVDHELARLGPQWGRMRDHCSVIDSLTLARRLHPGQKNSLDALCKRYSVDNTRRTLHGALLDAEILAEVYLAMTGGQTALSLDAHGPSEAGAECVVAGRLPADRPRLPVVRPSAEEAALHQARLNAIEAASGGQCLWRQIEQAVAPAPEDEVSPSGAARA
ncbi:DNA polymerase III subunit epsilon [Ectothiorhodospiraceae bacterium 2226]|nr:DNA polymerase III subunit epsilon [Ectothiorhodospiraceae bacterium 2226]